MENFILAAFLISWVVAGIIFFRNPKILLIEHQAITAIFNRSDWEKRAHLMQRQHYVSKIFDLRKSTFEDFYPELVRDEHEQF